MDRHQLTRKKTKVGLPILAIHRQRTVAPHSSPYLHGQRVSQLCFIEAVDRSRMLLVHRLRTLSQ
jgi:hypothetical protein